ncbi:hypothetical protein L917_21587, partial [Phytophthora nicotianae]
ESGRFSARTVPDLLSLTMWLNISVKSNMYHLSTINKHAGAQYMKYTRKNPSSDNKRTQ